MLESLLLFSMLSAACLCWMKYFDSLSFVLFTYTRITLWRRILNRGRLWYLASILHSQMMISTASLEFMERSRKYVFWILLSVLVMYQNKGKLNISSLWFEDP